MKLSERIRITTQSSADGIHDVIGYVDGKEVIKVSNRIYQTWGIGSSATLPYDFTLALLYTECSCAVMEHVKTLKSFARGIRVEVNQSSGFNRGAKGVIEFVEPSGERIWVLRDGSVGPVFFRPHELDIIQ